MRHVPNVGNAEIKQFLALSVGGVGCSEGRGQKQTSKYKIEMQNVKDLLEVITEYHG